MTILMAACCCTTKQVFNCCNPFQPEPGACSFNNPNCGPLQAPILVSPVGGSINNWDCQIGCEPPGDLSPLPPVVMGPGSECVWSVMNPPGMIPYDVCRETNVGSSYRFFLHSASAALVCDGFPEEWAVSYRVEQRFHQNEPDCTGNSNLVGSVTWQTVITFVDPGTCCIAPQLFPSVPAQIAGFSGIESPPTVIDPDNWVVEFV